MSIKKTICATVVILGFGLPLLATASPLTIINNSDEDSTSKVNGGPCSNILLGEKGITRHRENKSTPTRNEISEGNINLACFKNKSNCVADVFMTANCSGPTVANVTFDTKAGIKSVDVKDNRYVIEGSGFNIGLKYRSEA